MASLRILRCKLLYCWALLLSAAEAHEWIDISHAYDNMTLHRPGILPFKLSRVFKGHLEHHWLELNNFEMSEHVGTHMDAPSHFWNSGWSLDQIPVDRYIARAIVIDMVAPSQADPDHALSAEILQSWKDYLGNFTYPTVVLIYTGNAVHWTNSSRYFYGISTDEDAYSNRKRRNSPDSEGGQSGSRDGQPGFDHRRSPVHSKHAIHYRTFHFPGISEGAAQMLADDPAVVGVGIDTPSLDPGQSKSLPAHVTLAAVNKFAVVNVADMNRIPNMGATVLVVPMKIGGGSGGPCRVLVRLPHNVVPHEHDKPLPPKAGQPTAQHAVRDSRQSQRARERRQDVAKVVLLR